MANLTFTAAKPPAKTCEPSLQNSVNDNTAENRLSSAISMPVEAVNVGSHNPSPDKSTATDFNPPDFVRGNSRISGTVESPIILDEDSEPEERSLERPTLETGSDLNAVAKDAASRFESQSPSGIRVTTFDASESPVLPAIDDTAPKSQNAQDALPPITIDSDAKPPEAQSSPPASGSKPTPYNLLSCRERKRIFVDSSRPVKLTKDMQQWFHKTNWLLDPFREDDNCWFHPSPPPARVGASGALRPCGKINKTFHWQDRRGRHSLVVNYGIICKLLYHKMTKQQKDGFINRQWHVSHLCGNWSCVNPDHNVIEPGIVNISRNNCFSHRSGCVHNPPCMKHKKVALDVDGRPIDHNLPVVIVLPDDEWDAWGDHNFGDDEDHPMNESLKDPEYPLSSTPELEDYTMKHGFATPEVSSLSTTAPGQAKLWSS